MTLSDKVSQLGEKLFTTIHDTVKDITNLDVTTMVGNAAEIDADIVLGPSTDFSKLNGKASVVGITRISVDGDIIEFLHGSDGQLTIDPELLKIHKENVQTAITTWNSFFRNLIEITATIAAIADPNSDRIELVRALKTNLEPLGKTEKTDE